MARLGLRIGRTYKPGAFSSFGRFTTPGAVFRFTDVYAENGSAVLNPMTARLEAHPSVTDWTIWFNEKAGQNNPGSFSFIAGSNDYESIPSVVQILQDCTGDGVGQVVAEIFPTAMIDGLFVIPRVALIDPFPPCAPPITPEFWTAFVNSFETP